MHPSRHLDITPSHGSIFHVRTTLNIDNDIYQAAKSIADMERKTVGQVVSMLLRKALLMREYRKEEDDIPAFRVSENAPPLTPERVREADEDAG